jgi:hypothetical protein
MPKCNNMVTEYIPKGFDYKAIETPCGSIGIDGLAICDPCQAKLAKQYPQGYRNIPGDTCKHGNYIGDAYGADYICGQCEDDY